MCLAYHGKCLFYSKINVCVALFCIDEININASPTSLAQPLNWYSCPVFAHKQKIYGAPLSQQ